MASRPPCACRSARSSAGTCSTSWSVGSRRARRSHRDPTPGARRHQVHGGLDPWVRSPDRRLHDAPDRGPDRWPGAGRRDSALRAPGGDQAPWPSLPPPLRHSGHTHRPEAHEWTSGRRSVVYLNPGAWPPRVDAPAAQVGPHFVWLGRRHDAYVRRPPCSISRPAGPISTRRTWKGSGTCAPPPASAAWSAS